jgi:hypothetical protein
VLKPHLIINTWKVSTLVGRQPAIRVNLNAESASLKAMDSPSCKRYAHCPDCGSEMRPSALLCRACFKRAGAAWAPIYRAAAARGESRQTTPDTRQQGKKNNARSNETRMIGEEEVQK